jgi:hypothetical protein
VPCAAVVARTRYGRVTWGTVGSVLRAGKGTAGHRYTEQPDRWRCGRRTRAPDGSCPGPSPRPGSEDAAEIARLPARELALAALIIAHALWSPLPQSTSPRPVTRSSTATSSASTRARRRCGSPGTEPGHSGTQPGDTRPGRAVVRSGQLRDEPRVGKHRPDICIAVELMHLVCHGPDTRAGTVRRCPNHPCGIMAACPLSPRPPVCSPTAPGPPSARPCSTAAPGPQASWPGTPRSGHPPPASSSPASSRSSPASSRAAG